MTYITDIQELRKAERYDSPQERRNSVRLRIEQETLEYLKKKAINEIPPGVCSEAIIIPVKQPDGQYKNDHHARGNSRHRQQGKINKRKSGE